MGTVLKYDNSFNTSSINGEEMEDFLVLQRDFEADGGLAPVEEAVALERRRRALDAIAAVFSELNLSEPSAAMKESVAAASGSDDTDSYLPRDVALISEKIKSRKITIIDVISALAKRGFAVEAENLLNVMRLRVSGDYLQTAAIVRDGRVISAINDPNDYSGPGSGYRVSDARRKKLADIRDVLTKDEVLRAEAVFEKGERARIAYKSLGAAAQGGRATMWLSVSVQPSGSSYTALFPGIRSRRFFRRSSKE